MVPAGVLKSGTVDGANEVGAMMLDVGEDSLYGVQCTEYVLRSVSEYEVDVKGVQSRWKTLWPSLDKP
jgi:hypothetical protein